MEITKDIIKIEVAKLIAKDIYETPNIFNNLKAEIIKDFLPKPDTKHQVIEEPINIPTKEQEEYEQVPNSITDDIEELENVQNLNFENKKDISEKIKNFKKGIVKNLYDDFEKTENRNQFLFPPFESENIIEHENFTYNPDGLPNFYKNNLLPLSNKKYSNSKLSPEDYKKIPSFTEERNPYERFEKPKEKAQSHFIEMHKMPEDVAEILKSVKNTSDVITKDLMKNKIKTQTKKIK